MTTISETVKILSDRLPELVWKLGAIQGEFHSKSLARGLFKERLEMTPQTCIDEINANLSVLKTHKDDLSARYLADRVSEQINVLVKLCQLYASMQPAQKNVSFGVQSISTRQQWLSELQENINQLSAQKQAMLAALNQKKASQKPLVYLQLQAEVGEIDRRLTLARETLERSMK